jgi:hypothetical protein
VNGTTGDRTPTRDPRAVEAALRADVDGAGLVDLVRGSEAFADPSYLGVLLAVVRDPRRDGLLRQEAIRVVALAVPAGSGGLEPEVVAALLHAAQDDDWWPNQVEALDRLRGRALSPQARDGLRRLAEREAGFPPVRDAARLLLAA